MSSSIFSIIGDPHITPKSIHKAPLLFDLVESMGNTTVWTGDLLDTKEIIRGSCLNVFIDYFKKSKLKHIVIVGNHDYFNLECEDHSLKSLSLLSNVTVIDSVVRMDDFNCIFMPYIHDKAKLKHLLKNNEDKTKTLIGHFEVSGFDFGNGHMCEDESITHKDFKNYKKVISGHFHKLQDKGNFLYVGSPFSHSFGEANQRKVVATYNTETGETKLIDTSFERHVSLEVNVNESDANSQVSNFIKSNSKNIIRVQLTGTSDASSSVSKEHGDLKIKWEDKTTDSVSTAAQLDETLDNKTQFQQWAKSIKDLDDETMKLGLSILETVNVK
jgi:hypothetical protein